MKIELKNVKHAAFASEETACFQATVYIDGVKAGEVSNDGKGGCNMYHPWELQKKLDDYAKTLPDVDVSELFSDDKKHTLPNSDDLLIGDLLGDYLEARTLKRHCKKETLFRIKSETYKRGEWRTLKAPFSPAARAHLIKKYGEDLGEILNETIK